MNVDKYDECKKTHSIWGIIALGSNCILFTAHNTAFAIPPIFDLYNTTIPEASTTAVVLRQEVLHTAKLNDCNLYNAANTGCCKLIIAAADETWYYKQLGNPRIIHS